MLCFDEFQVVNIADTLILSQLFDGFWGCGGAVVSTRNRAPEKLYRRGLNKKLHLSFTGELKRRCEVWSEGGRGLMGGWMFSFLMGRSFG